MAAGKLDPRATLAKMEAEEAAAASALDAIQKANAETKAAVLKELRDTDLEDVKAKCKMHGFTVSDLRGALKARGAGRKTAATPRKSTGRKPGPKKRSATK